MKGSKHPAEDSHCLRGRNAAGSVINMEGEDWPAAVDRALAIRCREDSGWN